jgi:enterochelin esterase family protein
MRTPLLLDNLIASGQIPPLVTVMIGNVDRSLELPCHQPFADALARELVPWLTAKYRISENPAQRIVAGQSYGGLAASFAALTHPDVFGNVISQSGSYWWKPDPLHTASPRRLGDAPEYCWLPSLAAVRPAVPVRFWMEVGRLEDRSFGDGIPGMVTVNRHFRDVLLAKGFDVTYREFGGGHDYACWRHNLADGLIALIGDA